MPRIPLCCEVTGTVWKIEAPIGSTVEAEATVLVVESMKMEIPVVSTAAGRVVEVLVQEGEAVQESQVVAIVET